MGSLESEEAGRGPGGGSDGFEKGLRKGPGWVVVGFWGGGEGDGMGCSLDEAWRGREEASSRVR